MSDFIYQVQINIPVDVNNVTEWFSKLISIESWINNNIAQYQIGWTYIHDNQNLTIGFLQPEYKTFFLLYYDQPITNTNYY